LHPAVGTAYYEEGELHRLRGAFADAEAAYRSAGEHGRAPTPGMALLRLAQGRVADAAASVRRMLDEALDDLGRVSVLPAFVEVVLAAGDVAAAAAAAQELDTIAARVGTPFVRALADHAGACTALSLGRPTDALRSARRACGGWQHLDVPYELARAQVVVAAACRALGDHDAARLEGAAARAAFERLGAHLALPTLATPARSTGSLPLTEREREVLRLLVAGGTNRAMGAQLRISEHTVARHVQNIFAKLGVGSRAAATAYAYEHDLV
jgi:DNA-binding CsgD family transcriptional regulator